MLGSELLQKARQSDAQAVEPLFVPEWDCDVQIRPLEADTLHCLQLEEGKVGADPALRWSIEAQWLVRGVVEPALTDAEARELLRTQAAPVDRIIGAIRLKSLVGVKAEDRALLELEQRSPELRSLAEFYRAARAQGGDLPAALERAAARLREAEETPTLESLAQALNAAWANLVDLEKKASSPTEPTATESGEPASS
jgi:hypothetical protein